jgi:hypothetical protein
MKSEYRHALLKNIENVTNMYKIDYTYMYIHLQKHEDVYVVYNFRERLSLQSLPD